MNDFRAFFEMLDDLGIASQTIEHEAVHTAQGLAQNNRADWEFPVKNILVEDKTKQLYLVTMHLLTPPLDLRELSKRAGAKGRLSFASAPTLAETLKVLPGSVTPFAVMNDSEHRVGVILDSRIREAATLSAHPLINTMTTTIKTAALLEIFRHTAIATNGATCR